MSRRGVAALLFVVTALGVTGCGAASDSSPPSGVDMLEIPTPTPDPDDFVDRIDNPWLPYAPGNVWVYEGRPKLTIEVKERPFTIEGVETTEVATTLANESHQVDYYAQDRDGNVWWFGREGDWIAGLEGAEAGLVMAASPRAGDGYRMALFDGVVEDRARVVSVADDEVVIEVRSDLEPGVTTENTYAPDIGLVRTERSGVGLPSTWELTSGP